MANPLLDFVMSLVRDPDAAARYAADSAQAIHDANLTDVTSADVNALIPVVTIVGGQLGVLLAGTVVVETIFALPGMGRLTVEAILYRDYPIVQTNVMLVAATLVTLNLAVDLTYAWLDPRIRYR